MSNQRVVSITTAQMEAQDETTIPAEIFEYRVLTRDDLVTKMIEARTELASLRNVEFKLEEYKSQVSKKDHYALASELYKLRSILVDVRKEVILKQEEAAREEIEAAKPKKDKEDGEEVVYASEAKVISKPAKSPKAKRKVGSN
jgi:hypothetical protein